MQVFFRGKKKDVHNEHPFCVGGHKGGPYIFCDSALETHKGPPYIAKIIVQ